MFWGKLKNSLGIRYLIPNAREKKRAGNHVIKAN